jgi:hypothetical protein
VTLIHPSAGRAILRS